MGVCACNVVRVRTLSRSGACEAAEGRGTGVFAPADKQAQLALAAPSCLCPQLAEPCDCLLYVPPPPEKVHMWLRTLPQANFLALEAQGANLEVAWADFNALSELIHWIDL